MPLLGALAAAPLDKGTPRFEASNLEIVSVDVGNLRSTSFRLRLVPA